MDKTLNLIVCVHGIYEYVPFWKLPNSAYVYIVIVHNHTRRIYYHKITKTLFLQIFGHAAFIKQKVRRHSTSCKFSATRPFKAAWPKICKKSVFVFILLYLLLPYGGTFSTIFGLFTINCFLCRVTTIIYPNISVVLCCNPYPMYVRSLESTFKLRSSKNQIKFRH